MRPSPARWFELLTSRKDLTSALECLAKTQAVELESHSDGSKGPALPDLRRILDTYDEYAQRYAAYWPQPLFDPAGKRGEPGVLLTRALEQLKGWEKEASPVVVAFQALIKERGDLDLLQVLLTGAREALPDLRLLAGAGPFLETAVFVLPVDAWPKSLPTGVITHRIVADDLIFLLAVGPKAQMGVFAEQLSALKGRPISLPSWLPGDAVKASDAVERRFGELQAAAAELEKQIGGLNDKYDLAHALGDFIWLKWFAENIPELPATERFAWITGWTSDVDGRALESALKQADVQFLLRMDSPPPGFESPMILRNPAWARPFEVFPRLLGVPGEHETDPSRIVAIIAPLLFGYMFGDVGQGAVLVVAGLILRSKLPALGLLVPGGSMSIVFGVCFGSVFSLEALIPPLWLHPLEQPIPVLVIPLILGAAIVMLGLVLDAAQAHWQHRARTWWQGRAGLLMCYLGMLGAVIYTGALWAVLVGALWYLGGGMSQAPSHPFSRLGEAAVELFESLLQLVVNTISFVRVGAFALAHAGLGAAIVGVSQATGSIWGVALVMVLGNALIIVLEGLVVGIQTTRLVLFEFFIRFLEARGRQFRPLPSSTVSADSATKRRTS